MSQEGELFRSGKLPTTVRVQQPKKTPEPETVAEPVLEALERARALRKTLEPAEAPGDRDAEVQLEEAEPPPAAPEPEPEPVEEVMQTVDGAQLDPKRTRLALSAALKQRIASVRSQTGEIASSVSRLEARLDKTSVRTD